MPAQSILKAMLPPLCVTCREPCGEGALLCRRCIGELNGERPVWGDPPPGLAEAVASFRHEGAARDLLQAFKFGRMPGLAPLMAGYMSEHVEALHSACTVVAVPPSRFRHRLRGFDPAGLLAAEVCRIAGAGLPASGVIRRRGNGRQRGRGREERLASPPLIEPVGRVDGPVLLIDDVITTGATVAACASALASCGAGLVTALSFTRRV
jgi:predicted amidophosphoribosyltransferase